MSFTLRTPLFLLGALAACQGQVGDPSALSGNNAPPGRQLPPGTNPPGTNPPGTNPPTALPPPDPAALFEPAALGGTGLRRLSKAELSASLTDLYGIDPGDLLSGLPDSGSSSSPFDNDYTAQGVSVSLIQALSSFSEAYAARVGAAPERIYALAGCHPSGPADEACFEAIVKAVGRRSLRRPLIGGEVQNYLGLLSYAEEEGRFESAVELLVQIFLQHPEQLYRVEYGNVSAADPSLVQLDDFQIGTRLAFLLTGHGPDEALLDAAAAGRLLDPRERQAQASRLLATPSAAAHWTRYHAMWLGYEGLTLPAPWADDLEEESRRLIERVVFEGDRAWLSIFSAEESYLTPALAEHYGLSAPAEPAWVPYPADRGGGVLSHGAFLAQGSKFGDTSPTLRGARLLERVLCGTLGAPPTDVDTDNPPPGPANACKSELYFMRNDGRCAGCHARTDNIGFGLENLGPSGEWRTVEAERPNCPVDGQGRALQQSFQGPRGLGEILSQSHEVERCAATQLFRFAVGRPETSEDAPTLAALSDQLRLTPRLQDLLVAMALSPSIAHRPR